jgi:hypothetical protein
LPRGTIFDVGVTAGTPWLHDACPEARYFLIDPTPHDQVLEGIVCKDLDITIVEIGLIATQRWTA